MSDTLCVWGVQLPSIALACTGVPLPTRRPLVLPDPTQESSRYERTLALLKKYDPEYKPPLPTPAPRPAAPAGRAPGVQGPRAPPQPQPAAGPKVVPALTQLWTRAADRLIGMCVGWRVVLMKRCSIALIQAGTAMDLKVQQRVMR